jgi:dTDP-4-dehydrorhamnose 3,5-epimerase-like enzyme
MPLGQLTKRGMARLTKLSRVQTDGGWLVDILSTDAVCSRFGQLTVFTLGRGAVRANHYHRQKHEWDMVLRGECRVRTEETRSRQRHEYRLRARTPSVLAIPPLEAHAFQNVGQTEAWVIVYMDRKYDPKDADTYPYQVIPPGSA